MQFLPDGAALKRLRCLAGLLQQTERNAKALVPFLGSGHRLKHEIDGGAGFNRIQRIRDVHQHAGLQRRIEP
jgi:hypothetical protein